MLMSIVKVRVPHNLARGPYNDAMQRVLVVGATSAIAAEAAQIYANRGERLHLLGRNEEKLAEVARRCTASVTTAAADFGELADNAAVVRDAIAALGGLDTVLIAHGALGDQLASERAFDEAEMILRVNFVSVVSLLIPLANHLEAAGRGRIGVITSVAGDRGRPRNYTYGAAKGALNVYLQGLRTRLYAAGVTVTTLKLGPVDSPMTRGHKKHALFGKPPSVARSIVAAIDAGQPEAYVPSFWRAIMPVVKNTPEAVFQRLPFLSGR
jgi:decaprenylphospho-beta-D-erythro-pentofuranosid-2-ulose 2-reductase